MKINKKGVSFSSLLPIVITFIIVGLMIILGTYLYQTMQTSLQTTSVLQAVNETLSAVDNSTGTTVALYDLPGFSMDTTTPVCVNASGAGYIIPETNYTATGAGTFTSTAATCPDKFVCGWDWNCTYDYTSITRNSAYNASAKVATGLGTFSNMLPIIALAMIFGVIISVIVGFLVVRGRGR
jgi:hypothetical protein